MKKYFMNAHTSEGFVSLLHQFWDQHDLWMVTGGSQKIRGFFLTELAKELVIHNEDIHLLLNPIDGETIEGLLLKSKNLLMLSDNEPLLPWSKYGGVFQKTIHLNTCLNLPFLLQTSGQTKHLIDKMTASRTKAYESFATGKEIHKSKEEITRRGMDFPKADKVTDDLIKKWLNKGYHTMDDTLVPSQLFFGGASAFGPINFIDDLTEDLGNRVIIKGKSGSGKSTLMNKFAKEAIKEKRFVQFFPCALDPQSVDMIIVPSLSLAIIDGTAPHVIEPVRSGDETIDMFELCMDQNIEVKHGKELNELDKQYKHIMKQGMDCLRSVYDTQQMIDDIYTYSLQGDKFQQRVKETIQQLISVT